VSTSVKPGPSRRWPSLVSATPCGVPFSNSSSRDWVHRCVPCDQLAQDAERSGLLSPESLEEWLRKQLKAKAAEQLFVAMDRMAAVRRSFVYVAGGSCRGDQGDACGTARQGLRLMRLVLDTNVVV
jgi:hypothetical protein